MQVLDRVRQFVRQHDLFGPDTRVAAAVSGGSDSVALAHVLAELDRTGEVRLAGLVHFNHRLRSAADSDEQFVRSMADKMGRRLLTSSGDVKAAQRQQHQSLESAARTARYRAFAAACRQLPADVIALGHTRDDQAETFLLRLTRGAGPRGLAGMHPRLGSIVRPLLACRRHELRTWLEERRLKYVEDETNADVSIPRNRVRAELLPVLASRFNPNIVNVLADQAQMAGEIWDWMAEQSDLLGVGDSSDVALDVARLEQVPVALRRAALWRAMSRAAGGRPVSFDHVSTVLGLVTARDGAIVDAPGQRVQRVGGQIVLTSRRGRTGRRLRDSWSGASPFRIPLSIPGVVEVPATGCVVTAEAEPAMPSSAALSNGSFAVVRRDAVPGRLAVRNRRPGDRFRPIGLGGWKKLQDLFVDRKVARNERDRVPIVVDDQDRIVWVAGHGIDEAFRVTDPTQAVLILKLKALGGSA